MSNTLSLSTFDTMKQLQSDLAESTDRINSLEIKLAQQVEFNQTQAASHAKEKEQVTQTLNAELVQLRTELDSLRHKNQIEALEALVGKDDETQAMTAKLDKHTKENRELKRELKELQAFDPKRQKKNIAALKTKSAEQAKVVKDLNAQLKAAKKEVSALKKEVAEKSQEPKEAEGE